MSSQSWMESLLAAPVDGAALANSAVQTAISPAAPQLYLPAGFFDRPGKSMRIVAKGRISTLVTSPGTLTFGIGLGTLGSPVIAWGSGAIALNVTAQSNATWELEAELTARAVGQGVSANLMGIGRFCSRALIGSPAVASGSPGVALLPDTAPAVGNGFDSTITNLLQLFATWSVANASNSITLHQLRAESVN